MEVINDEGMPRASTGLHTIVVLLISIFLSVAIGLAMLITALAPASVAAPCGIAVASLHNHTAGAACPLASSRSTCCTRLPIG